MTDSGKESESDAQATGQQVSQQDRPDAAAAEAADGDDDVDPMCGLLWAAAIKNRPRPRGQPAPAAETDTADIAYLIHLVDHEQLIPPLVAATAAAVGTTSDSAGLASATAAATAAVNAARQGVSNSPDLAAAAASFASGAAAVVPKLNKASLLPALQLLTTLSCCIRAASVHARSRAQVFNEPQVQDRLLLALNQGGRDAEIVYVSQ